MYSLTADARSVQVPNKRDVSGVTRESTPIRRRQCSPSGQLANSTVQVLTLLRLPAIHPFTQLGRDEALHGIEHAQDGGEGDPERKSAAVEGRLG